MKLLTPQQIKEIDERAINSLKIPGIVLMENAAIQLAAKVSSLLKNKEKKSVTVVAGIGNNGGDAFAVTRHLLAMGYSVSIYSMKDLDTLSGDALTNAVILKNIGMDVPVLSDEEKLTRLKRSCIESSLVIDGLLGTGINRDVDGIWLKVIEIINEYSSFVLSIDIASGVDGLTGKIRGACVKADATVTFHLPKLGLVQYPGAAFIGELTVADIGIPYQLSEHFDSPQLLERNYILSLLPTRPEDGHKGTFGKVFIIAGSVGMTGAAYLSTLSCYRMGTGIVRVASPASCISTLSILMPEAVFLPLTEKDGHICLPEGKTDLDMLRNYIRDADAVLIGPGLSCSNDTLELLEFVVQKCEAPIVFDADAITLLAKDKSLLERLRCEAIITPHPAEMARLVGLDVSMVQDDRLGTAKSLADEYGITVVLKGAATVIAANSGDAAINSTGNNGMGTAGSGDVLAGIITSLLGQGMEPYEASVAGVYVHGLSGDLAAAEKGTASIIASDIAQFISKALVEIKNIK